MNKNVIFIGGGYPKENYIDYESYIKEDFNPMENQYIKWSETLGNDIKEKYNLIKFIAPNKDFASYYYWKIAFDIFLKKIDYNVDILIGYSLGGSFLTKYIEEGDLEGNLEFIKNKVKKIILIAPVFEDDGTWDLGSFKFNNNLKNLRKIENKIFLMHSKDDLIVPFYNNKMYKKQILGAKNIVFNKKGHFFQEKFPELVECILDKS